MGSYIIDVHGDGARYSHCALRQDFYSWLIENNISAYDIKWEFDEIIKNWTNKQVEIYPVEDQLSNNEFNGPGLSEYTTIEVVDKETDEIVFSTKLDKKSLEKYKITTSISSYRTDTFINGSKLIIETGSQGDVYLIYKLETEFDFDPSKLVIEANEIDDDALIINLDYEDSNSDINNEDSGYDDKGCSPEYVVVENGFDPQKPHSFLEGQCTDWFGITVKPIRNGFYEAKKCDEQVESVMLKWNSKAFYRQEERRQYDKNWNVKSTKIVDVQVPNHDIVKWRGLKVKH